VSLTASSSSPEVGGTIVQAGVRSRVAAVPTWLLLGGLFAISFVYRFVYALRDPAPWIFHDELVYSELAKSFGETGHFAMRGVPGTGGFAVLYPILISPAYALFDRIPDAYDGVRAINCLLMSATVIPVYLIARRLAPRHLALLAAALSIALEPMMYTGTVMTENAFYPLVSVWALVLIRALERPTVFRQLVVFGVLGLAFLTRVQAVVLLPALVIAIAVVVLLDALAARDGSFARRFARGALRFWPTWATLVLGSVAVVVRQSARGATLSDLLGAYGGVSKFDYDVADIAHWLLYHVAELDILLGVLPLAALITIVLWSLRPSQPRELRIFAAVAVGLVPVFMGVAAAYATDPVANRIVERNFFHVAPIAFIALAAWVARGAPRPWWAVAPAALFAGSLTLALPLNNFLDSTAVHSTSGLLPFWRWRDHVFSRGSIDEVVFVAAALGAVLFVLIPRRFAVVLPVLVLGFYVAANRPVEGFTHLASVQSREDGIGTAPRDWIDRAVGSEKHVASLWWSGTDAVPYWESQFFNRSMERAYTLSGPYDGLFHTFTQVLLLPSGELPQSIGPTIYERYVLTDTGTRLRGRIVALNDRAALAVYDMGSGRLSVGERIDGLYPDNWSYPRFLYRRFGCKPGTVVFSIENNPLVHPKSFTVPVVVNGSVTDRFRFARSPRQYVVSVPVRPEGKICSVEMTMPTGPASRVTPGDARQLGLRFQGIRYFPRR
jgi:hypothetical protein